MKSKHLKKIISGLTAVSMLAAIGTAPVYADTLAGDLNEDGKVNAVDFVLMKKYIINTVELGEQALLNADMNSSGEVNIFDAILLAKQLIASQNTEPTDPAEPTEPSETEESTITLAGTSIETSSKTVKIDGTHATITVPGKYIITGTLADGQIAVDVDKDTYPKGKVELSLEGVDISCSDNSPIYIAKIDDECVITVKKGTENIISDGTEYENTDGSSGAIYSKDNLKIKGKGSLTVNGNYKDGIVCKDKLKIFNGNITVNAADDGIKGKDCVKIGDADDIGTEGAFENLKLTVNAKAGDGIKSTNDSDETKGYIEINGGDITVDSYADAFQAETNITVNGGNIDISTFEGSTFTGTASSAGNWGGRPGGGGGMQDGNSNKTDISAKGMKAAGTITINAGTMNIDSSDDCLHCAGNMNLIGGKLTLATADDACHSDADLTIGNGTADTFDDIVILVSACYEGIEGMNITQNSGTVIINSTDDGYNAAGGVDGSGETSPGGWGGFPGMGGGNTGNYSMNLKGGLGLVNATDGDHDGYDSNGSLTISGGYFISNGNEPFDSDGAKSYTGGVYITEKGSSGGFGGGMPGSTELSSTVTASCSADKGTRITLADGDKIIVSFIADKSVTSLTAGCNDNKDAKFYTGGEITGTPIVEFGSQACYVGGAISGGTELAAGSSSTQPNNPWGGRSVSNRPRIKIR